MSFHVSDMSITIVNTRKDTVRTHLRPVGLVFYINLLKSSYHCPYSIGKKGFVLGRTVIQDFQSETVKTFRVEMSFFSLDVILALSVKNENSNVFPRSVEYTKVE